MIEDVNMDDVFVPLDYMTDKFSTRDQYEVYGIPKKSGGKRMIEAPDDNLKEAQQASLRRMKQVYVEYDDGQKAFKQCRDAIDKILRETEDTSARAERLTEAKSELSSNLTGNQPVLQYSHYAHAFAEGRNIASGAEPHVGAEAVITADLTDFFPSVKWHHFDPDYDKDQNDHKLKSYNSPMAYAFGSSKMSEKQEWKRIYREHIVPELKMHFCDFGDGKGLRLPQGAPASPYLSNVILCRFDYRAGWKCYAHGVTYTRYADDLIFSGPSVELVKRAYADTVALLAPLGLQINKRKYTLKSGNQRKKILGLVVNERLNTTRYFRRRLRAAQHHCKVIHTIECLGKQRGFTPPSNLRPYLLTKTEDVSFGVKMRQMVEAVNKEGGKLTMEDLQSKRLMTPPRWMSRKIQGHSAFQHMVENPPVNTQTSLRFCAAQEMMAQV